MSQTVRSLSTLDRFGLSMCYARPLKWHPPAARLLGVRILPAKAPTPDEIDEAEADSRRAVRYFVLEVLTVVVMTAVVPILAISVFLLMSIYVVPLDSSLSDMVAVAVYLGVVLPFLALTFWLARTSVLKASTGVAIALGVAGGMQRPDLTDHPRLEYVLDRLVRR